MSQSHAPLGDPNHAIDLALFGALGDLAMRKLFPALYHLDREGLMPASTRIMGLARQEHDTAEFRQLVSTALQKRLKKDEQDKASMERFLQRLEYLKLDFTTVDGYDALRQWREGARQPMVVYLSVAARIYGDICHNLQASNSLDDDTRVIVEKPIGYDLASSEEINDAIGAVFPESRIYRIDHYLGKETVQNLIALRFANPLFGTQWNQNHISHVEITVAEKVGIEGRWGYFDDAGQLRDMVQNHLLQLLCLIAMDPPSNLDADAIRDEKVKVLKALKPFTGEALGRDVVRGQYIAGTSDGRRAGLPGRRGRQHPEPDRNLRGHEDRSVQLALGGRAVLPAYRQANAGKAVANRHSFPPAAALHLRPDQRGIASNKLIIRLQPEEGIALQVLTKDSGLDKGMRLRPGPLHLDFNNAFPKSRIPDAYERLLLEVMKGQQYLFVRRDEVEHAWRWCDQLIDGWKSRETPPRRYPAGSWGPVASIAMITQDGRSWYEDY